MKLYHSTTKENLESIKSNKTIQARYPSNILGYNIRAVRNKVLRIILRKMLNYIESNKRTVWLSSREINLNPFKDGYIIEMQISKKDYKQYVKNISSLSGCINQLLGFVFCSKTLKVNRHIYLSITDVKLLNNGERVIASASFTKPTYFNT
ncbi:hypothetical protein [Pasteurella multocida]|uniref:hypothetical protein n=1 Tax=Pasteurella multocida TaxID=747 RepID=UPI00397C992B